MDSVSLLIKRIVILEEKVRMLEKKLRLSSGQLNPIGYTGKKK